MPSYDVVILAEQPLSPIDVASVRSLHEAVEDPVRYHVLLPVDEAANRVETTMAALAGPEMIGAPAPVLDAQTIRELEKDFMDQARKGVSTSESAFKASGADAVCELVTAAPLDALIAKVAATDAAEVIVLTRPHVVSEFFHQDWTSKARKKLGVPVLHLIEHENFDEQAGYGEGVTGM